MRYRKKFIPERREARLETKMNKTWKFRCRNNARQCGTKHTSISKRTNHTSFGPLLDAEMSKNWTPLQREADFQIKSVGRWRIRTIFARSDVLLFDRHKYDAPCQKSAKRRSSVADSITTTTILHCTIFHLTTLTTLTKTTTTTATTTTSTTTTTTTSSYYYYYY